MYLLHTAYIQPTFQLHAVVHHECLHARTKWLRPVTTTPSINLGALRFFHAVWHLVGPQLATQPLLTLRDANMSAHMAVGVALWV